MKTRWTWLVVVMTSLGWPLVVGAGPHVAADQFINCDANGYYYWAMIWDYTHGQRESSTPGAVNVDYYKLEYRLTSYGEVHVAYLYDWATGRYIEAQALRHVRL